MKTKQQGADKRGDVVIYLRMDKTLATEMKAIAKRQSRTIAGQIAFALWQWLDAQDDKAQRAALAGIEKVRTETLKAIEHLKGGKS